MRWGRYGEVCRGVGQGGDAAGAGAHFGEVGRAKAAAAGWRVEAGGASGIWSVELVARWGREPRHRGCMTGMSGNSGDVSAMELQ